MVDFGDPTAKACGADDPRLYVRGFVIEEAAADLLGMVPQAKVDELNRELDECAAERARLAAIVSGMGDLSAAEEKLRAALGVSPADPHDGTETEEKP